MPQQQAEQEYICSSCKRKISNVQHSTSFPCPQCQELEIVRCGKCRKVSAKYKCKSCGFEGPN